MSHTKYFFLSLFFTALGALVVSLGVLIMKRDLQVWSLGQMALSFLLGGVFLLVGLGGLFKVVTGNVEEDEPFPGQEASTSHDAQDNLDEISDAIEMGVDGVDDSGVL